MIYLSPTRFSTICRYALPISAFLTFFLIPLGLYFALFASPPDYLQGDMVRVMYIHVPSAWAALSAYLIIALCNGAFLVWRNPLLSILAKAATPIGACFTAITLLTGMLWGKPTWGAWWVWDARLTSVLILFFFYLGLLALMSAFDDQERSAKAAALLSLVGVVNIPIVKFSVDWWNTLHQPASVFRLKGAAIAPEMLLPLAMMAIGLMAFFIYLWLIRAQTSVMARKLLYNRASAL